MPTPPGGGVDTRCVNGVLTLIRKLCTIAGFPPMRWLSEAAQTHGKRAQFLRRAFFMDIGSTCGLQAYIGVL